jgi:hypothetical protein
MRRQCAHARRLPASRPRLYVMRERVSPAQRSSQSSISAMTIEGKGERQAPHFRPWPRSRDGCLSTSCSPSHPHPLLHARPCRQPSSARCVTRSDLSIVRNDWCLGTCRSMWTLHHLAVLSSQPPARRTASEQPHNKISFSGAHPDARHPVWAPPQNTRAFITRCVFLGWSSTHPLTASSPASPLGHLPSLPFLAQYTLLAIDYGVLDSPLGRSSVLVQHCRHGRQVCSLPCGHLPSPARLIAYSPTRSAPRVCSSNYGLSDDWLALLEMIGPSLDALPTGTLRHI